MNQKQREYLVDHVDAIHKKELHDHDELEPEEPNLSNHLVADILGGTAKMKTIDHLREKIHKRVMRAGKRDAFLTGDSHTRWDKEDQGDCILLKALDILVTIANLGQG